MSVQFDLISRKEPKVIDLSFVPLAPGEPKTLYKRFRIAPFPPGGTVWSSPPWTVQGILLWPEFKPTIYTYRDVETERLDFVQKFVFPVNGCSVRADIFKLK
ncbi:MAG: hypothetical protein WCC06_02650 [Candidatus Aminicenantales bacterium]